MYSGYVGRTSVDQAGSLMMKGREEKSVNLMVTHASMGGDWVQRKNE